MIKLGSKKDNRELGTVGLIDICIGIPYIHTWTPIFCSNTSIIRSARCGLSISKVHSCVEFEAFSAYRGVLPIFSMSTTTRLNIQEIILILKCSWILNVESAIISNFIKQRIIINSRENDFAFLAHEINAQSSKSCQSKSSLVNQEPKKIHATPSAPDPHPRIQEPKVKITLLKLIT